MMYDFQCNVMLPVVSIIRNIPLFLAFNSVFFCIPIYTSLKGPSCKLNPFIKSLYLPIFNLGIMIMVFLKDMQDMQALSIVSLFVTLIIFLGTLHEILEVIVNIFYQIGFFLFSKNRVQNLTNR